MSSRRQATEALETQAITALECRNEDHLTSVLRDLEQTGGGLIMSCARLRAALAAAASDGGLPPVAIAFLEQHWPGTLDGQSRAKAQIHALKGLEDRSEFDEQLREERSRVRSAALERAERCRDPEEAFRFAHINAEAGERTVALAYARRAWALRKDMRYASRLAAILRRGGRAQQDEAQQILQEAIERDPSPARNSACFVVLAALHRQRGALQQATELIERVLGSKPDDRAWSTLGAIYFDRGDLVRSADAFSRAYEHGYRRTGIERSLSQLEATARARRDEAAPAEISGLRRRLRAN